MTTFKDVFSGQTAATYVSDDAGNITELPQTQTIGTGVYTPTPYVPPRRTPLHRQIRDAVRIAWRVVAHDDYGDDL